MGAADWTTVVMHNGERFLGEDGWGTSLTLSGYTFSGGKEYLTINNQLFGLESSETKNLEGYELIPGDRGQDIHIAKLDGYILCGVEGADDHGAGTSYLYLVHEKENHVYLLVTGFGNYGNPLLHFLHRGIPEDVEDVLISHSFYEFVEMSFIADLLDGFYPTEIDNELVQTFWKRMEEYNEYSS